MKVEVSVGDTTETVDVDFASLTLQESCDVEEQIGTERFEALTNGQVTPITMRAITWAKLRKRYPDLAITDVDFELVEGVQSMAAGKEEGGEAN